MTFTGVMLAGGKSSRLGADKSLLLGPRVEAVLRQCFPAVLVIRQDDTPGLGPIGGLVTALRRAATDAIFLTACDMPFLDPSLIHEITGQLPGHDAVVPRIGEHYEPLHAAYHRRCLPVVEARIAAGNLALHQLIPHLHARILDRPDWRHPLTNVNTPADLKQTGLTVG